MAQEKATRTSKQAVFGQEEIAALIDKFLSIEGPDEKSFKRLNWVIQRYFAPTIVGLENIPD